MVTSGVILEKYAVEPIMSTNNTAARCCRTTESGLSISRSCSTRCGEKNLAKFVRWRSASLRRSVTDKFLNERNVVMPIATRLMTDRNGAVPTILKPWTIA